MNNSKKWIVPWMDLNVRQKGWFFSRLAFVFCCILLALFFWGNELSHIGWLNKIFILCFFSSFVLILGIAQEKNEIFSKELYWRLPWRIFQNLCILFCILSFLQIFQIKKILHSDVALGYFYDIGKKKLNEKGVGVSQIGNMKVGETSTAAEKVSSKQNINPEFVVIFALFSSVVAFAGKHIYGIAKDAEEKVQNIDAKMKMSVTQFLRAELYCHISVFLSEWDRDGKFRERMFVQMFKNLAVDLNKLNDKIFEQGDILNKLQAYLLKFESGKNYALDSEFLELARSKFAPYLEDFIKNFQSNPNSTTKDGQACLDEVIKIWRLFR